MDVGLKKQTKSPQMLLSSFTLLGELNQDAINFILLITITFEKVSSPLGHVFVSTEVVFKLPNLNICFYDHNDIPHLTYKLI